MSEDIVGELELLARFYADFGRKDKADEIFMLIAEYRSQHAADDRRSGFRTANS